MVVKDKVIENTIVHYSHDRHSNWTSGLISTRHAFLHRTLIDFYLAVMKNLTLFAKNIYLRIIFISLSVVVNMIVLHGVVLAFLLSSAVSFRSTVFRSRAKCDNMDLKSETTGGYRPSNICIVGGGFGGLYAALSLSSRVSADTNIYLIDPKDRFVFLPLLYELATGSASSVEVAPKYDDILAGSRVKFIRGSVEDVDVQNNRCHIKEYFEIKTAAQTSPTFLERTLPFDQIVLAAGSQPKLDFIPGAKENSIPFYRLEDCYRLKSKLSSLRDSKKGFVRVVVIGAGYSGVELATNVAEYFGRDRVAIKVVDRNTKIMPTSVDYNRDVAKRSLVYRGISVSYNCTVKEINTKGVHLVDETGSEFFAEADVVLFTAGSEQSPIIKRLPLLKNRTGRIRTRRTLQALEYDNIFCIGDCAAIENDELPCTAQVALQQSQTVARNIQLLRERKDKALAVFRFIPLGEMLTLGTLDAAISSLGGLVSISGPLAAIGRRAIYAVRMPTTKQTIKALVASSAVTAGKLMSDLFDLKGKIGQDHEVSNTTDSGVIGHR